MMRWTRRTACPSDQAVILVQIGDASVLIDPAYDEPWHRHGTVPSPTKWPGITRTPGLAAGLASIGVRPEEITHVLITHAHDDHFAGVIPHARRRGDVGFPERASSHQPEGFGRAIRAATGPGYDLSTRLGAVARSRLARSGGRRSGDRTRRDDAARPGRDGGALHRPRRIRLAVLLRARRPLPQRLGSDASRLGVAVGRSSPPMRASRERPPPRPSRATINFTHERFPMWGRIVATDDGYRWERT